MVRRFAFSIAILAVLGCGMGNASESGAGDKDIAAAEARKAKQKGKVTEPAVDTSQLTTAPDWELLNAVSGEALNSRDLRGKVVLVDFWATWCGPCKRSIPHLKELYTEYRDEGVEVVGVSLDQKGPPVVRPFMDQYKINYPVVMGNAEIVQAFGGVRGIPTAFIISQDGKVYSKYVGLRPKDVYENDIRQLLGLAAS